jgi:hypothetical protein
MCSSLKIFFLNISLHINFLYFQTSVKIKLLCIQVIKDLLAAGMDVRSYCNMINLLIDFRSFYGLYTRMFVSNS